jgi:hypothetical protein
VNCKILLQEEKTVCDLEHCYVIRAPKTMGSYAAFIIMDNKVTVGEDVEILKALASQALFLFTLERQRIEVVREKKPENV